MVSKRASLHADHYGSSLSHFKKMFAELKRDFPWIWPKDVEVVEYGGDRIKRIWGIEVIVNDLIAVPAPYYQWDWEEVTLSPRNLIHVRRAMSKSYTSHHPRLHGQATIYCLIRTKIPGNTLHTFLDFMHEARMDFPTLYDEDVKFEHYAGTSYRGTFGMEWQLPKGFKVPPTYKLIDELEYTL